MPPRRPGPQRTCQFCGAAFIHYDPRNPGRYCSKLCSNRANAQKRRRAVQRACAHCHALFVLPRPSSRQTYCSHLCARLGYAVTHLAEQHPLWKAKPLMRCEVCGKECVVKPSLASRFRACSRRCAAALHRKPRTSRLEVKMRRAMRAIGLRPTPQHRIGYYSVDFAFPEARLVVECDGSYWHSLPKQRRLDHSKDAFLSNRGWLVIRLPETAIKASAAACARQVRAALMAPRPPAGLTPGGS
jgi:very-short-patch-repair endonuclease